MIKKSALVSFVCSFAVLFAGISGIACNTDGDCSEQSCADFGGSSSKKLTSCYSSGSGSVNDEFVLKDENDNEFYTCSRKADDNDGCGVQLITAKRAYCTQNAPSGASTSSSSSSSSSSSGSSGTPVVDSGTSQPDTGATKADTGTNSSGGGHP